MKNVHTSGAHSRRNHWPPRLLSNSDGKSVAGQRAIFAQFVGSNDHAHNVKPIEEDGDLFGSTVILASRIAAKAGTGEILIPEPLRTPALGHKPTIDLPSSISRVRPSEVDEALRLATADDQLSPDLPIADVEPSDESGLDEDEADREVGQEPSEQELREIELEGG